VNRRRATIDPVELATFPTVARYNALQRMAVMGNGDIVVGENPPAWKSDLVRPEISAERTGGPLSGSEERHYGAMSQQRANNGAMSTPQKSLRLIGYRDPKVRPSGGW
jgi:hypothetical protein